jgi:hypothetical protein
MNGLDKISREKLVEAALAIEAACEPALRKYRDFVDPLPRRMKVEQRERAAFLKGVLTGLAQARRELEMRCPIDFYGSSAQPQSSETERAG